MPGRKPTYRTKALTIACTDLRQSERFYRTNLGAEVMPTDDGIGCPGSGSVPWPHPHAQRARAESGGVPDPCHADPLAGGRRPGGGIRVVHH